MKYKLKDVVSFIDGDRGKNYPKLEDFSDKGFCLFLDTSNVLKDGFSFEKIRFITEGKNKLLRKGLLSYGDIVYTTRGTIGNVGYYDDSVLFENVRINSGMVILRTNEKFNSKFLYHYLKSDLCRFYFCQFVTGSAQPQLPIKNFKNIEIDLPPLPVQRRIADILSAYDDLIENNRKQIKLLEEAAQRLYKEWFVDLRFPGHEKVKVTDGVPEGWERKPISGIAEYLNGYAFAPCDWFEQGKPIIKIKEMNAGISKDTPRNSGENVPDKYLVKAGDILFSWSATLTAMIWNDEDGLLNQHLFKVTPFKGISREFVLQAIKNLLMEIQNNTTGSTMKHIQRGKLDVVKVILPNDIIMKNFDSLTYVIREKILKLSKHIKLLQEARDRLLPKLMSGEIEV